MPTQTTGHATFDGFVHAGTGTLHDGHGTNLLLRGVGLGNWLLPEGYMWRLPDHIDSPRRIEALIEEHVGPAQSREFWRRFRDTFISEDDVLAIAGAGFDHVRLPINWRVVMDAEGHPATRGLALVDQLIEWCRTHRLWVILDLHGAPGGQTGTNIDDSPNRRPELFEVAEHRELTVHLWHVLAQRYRDETVVAGYDLLNEPLPDNYQHRYADRLVELYQDLTTTIRAVDPHHLIIYEGTHWATNWSIFTEVWDPNSMLQFHRYWCPPDRRRIQPYLDTRDRLGLPIYMGEGGENNLDWLQTAFQLYEDHHISWNFWPWKKIDTLTSPCSVTPPTGWPDALVDAADPQAAGRVLEDLLDAMPFHQCTFRPEIINTLLRRPPLRLPATGFSFRGPGRSYGTNGARPLSAFRSDDHVTIRHIGGKDAPIKFHHTDGSPRQQDETLLVELTAGDWVSYDLHLDREAEVRINIRADIAGATTPATPMVVHLGPHTAEPTRPSVDGVWSATVGRLSAGQHQLRLKARTPVTVWWLDVTTPATSGSPAPATDGDAVYEDTEPSRPQQS